jgi:NTP pyrophosphatase (non-canonical NTP hydrolase)
MTDVRDKIFESISEARFKADNKWGDNSLFFCTDKTLAVTVLLEEVGEVARAVLENDNENLKNELIDVAQVVVAWLDSMTK